MAITFTKPTPVHDAGVYEDRATLIMPWPKDDPDFKGVGNEVQFFDVSVGASMHGASMHPETGVVSYPSGKTDRHLTYIHWGTMDEDINYPQESVTICINKDDCTVAVISASSDEVVGVINF
jgi:hypothetical protein|tara:strand:- start:899 stop:1264 length:366 start_codon:yes stop_codon:yes gene_type:complete